MCIYSPLPSYFFSAHAQFRIGTTLALDCSLVAQALETRPCAVRIKYGFQRYGKDTGSQVRRTVTGVTTLYWIVMLFHSLEMLYLGKINMITS